MCIRDRDPSLPLLVSSCPIHSAAKPLRHKSLYSLLQYHMSLIVYVYYFLLLRHIPFNLLTTIPSCCIHPLLSFVSLPSSAVISPRQLYSLQGNIFPNLKLCCNDGDSSFSLLYNQSIQSGNVHNVTFFGCQFPKRGWKC